MNADDLPPPAPGSRTFTVERKVRLGDTWTDGTLRLDALARYLQDIATDDSADAGLGATIWVLRRVLVQIGGRPGLHDPVALTTFCSGVGLRWAERRTSLVGPSSRIEVGALWVHVDPATGVPTRYPPEVETIYGVSAQDRKVSGRLTLPGPPADGTATTPWPVRPTDFDVLGHVNNALAWTLLDGPTLRPASALLEYRAPIEPGTEVDLVTADHGLDRWLVGASGVHASARLDPA